MVSFMNHNDSRIQRALHITMEFPFEIERIVYAITRYQLLKRISN